MNYQRKWLENLLKELIMMILIPIKYKVCAKLYKIEDLMN